MTNKKPDPFLVDEDSPIWTKEDFRKARPIREVFPDLPNKMAELSRKVGRPPAKDKMQTFTIRLSASDIEKLRAKGSDKTRELLHLFANA
jgi:uncharacterized protein (DUF4415 family)